jgi:hypothetical protein
VDLTIQGGRRVRLERGHFVAQGGEAAVYARGDLAFKVYLDPGRMIPPAKIAELARLTLPNIIRPQAVLLDGSGQPVGYTMRRVPDARVLCQLFPRAFRERHGVTAEITLGLVQRLQEGVRHVHTQGILVVDLNELNFLVDDRFREVLFIDVDSYQTPGFPATALMDSIRDRQASTFSKQSDWFSFAVVSFELFAGIHPYRGRHPTLPDLDARMRHNASVFSPQVALPPACYPLETIPRAYRDWYRAVFEEGKRCPPPAGPVPVIALAPSAGPLRSGHQLRVRELHRFPAPVIRPVPADGPYAAVTTAGLAVGSRIVVPGSDLQVAFTPRERRLVAACLAGRQVRLYDVARGDYLPETLAGEALAASGGRLYVKSGGQLHLVEFVELPRATRAALRPVASVMEHATQLFDGVAIQNVLGSCYATLLTPGGTHTLPVRELDGCRVVDARLDDNVLIVAAAVGSHYDRLVLRFATDYRAYDLRRVPDVTYSGLNFAALASGVCLCLNEEEELELFSSRIGSPAARTLADEALRGARLFKDGNEALLAKGETLYSMSMA